MISGLPPVSPQQYATSAAAHREALQALQAEVDHLGRDRSTVDGDMYGHLSMQQAVRNDRARAVAGIQNSRITMGIGAVSAAGAGLACVAWGPGVLSVLGVAAGAFIAWSAARYQARAHDAIGKMDSMQTVVDRCVADAKQKQDDIERRLQAATGDIAAHRAQLELLEVARRVAATSAAPGSIVREEQLVRIGGVTVPRAKTRAPG